MFIIAVSTESYVYKERAVTVLRQAAALTDVQATAVNTLELLNQPCLQQCTRIAAFRDKHEAQSSAVVFVTQESAPSPIGHIRMADLERSEAAHPCVEDADCMAKWVSLTSGL